MAGMFDRIRSALRRDKTPENHPLLKAMHDVALNDGPTTRKDLYVALMESTLIVPGHVSGGKDGVADDNTRLAIQPIEDPPGNLIVPVFTDQEAFKNWIRGIPTASFIVPAREFFVSLTGGNIKGIVINPFPTTGQMVRPGGRITAVEFEALGKGFIPHLDTYRERVFDMTLPPRDSQEPRPARTPLPGKVYALISEAVANLPVSAVYHCEIEVGPDQFTPVVGVELSAPETPELTNVVMTGISRSLESYDDPQFGVDLFVVRPADASRLRTLVTPFYLREGADVLR